MDVIIFGITVHVERVAFEIGNFWTLYWYGILIAIGFCLAAVYGFFNAKRFNIDSDRMVDVVLVTLPIAILCARLYYVIFYEDGFVSFKEFFGIGEGHGFSGLAIYGGVIGAAVVGGIMCKLRKVKILDMFDLASLGFLIGQGVGRWGNFVNQEAFGGLTGSDFWGMQSANTIAECGVGMVHPCFLYESFWCILGFVLLHLLSKKRKFSGQIALAYCVWYGFGRAIIESLRTDSLMIGPFKVSMLLSIALCVGGAVVYFLVERKLKINAVQKTEYTSMFQENETEEETAVETAEEVLEEKAND